jgi:hypothetical protein
VGLLQTFPQTFEVGDGLLEDVAEDVHVYDRADGGASGGVGYFACGPIVIVAQFLEMGADFVGHLEGVQGWIEGEEAAVVGGDVQAGVPCVNGAEEAAEVVPERVRVVGVAMLEGMLEGFGGEQAEVFAKGAEQDPVQQLLAVDDFALEAASEDLESQGQSHPKPRLSESGMKNAE